MYRHLLTSSALIFGLTGCGGLIESIDSGIEQLNKSLEDVNAIAEQETEPANLNEPAARTMATPQAQPATRASAAPRATPVNQRQYTDAALFAYHAESSISVNALASRMARWETAEGHLAPAALGSREAELRQIIPAKIKQADAIPHYTLDFPITFIRYDKYQHYYYFSFDDAGARVFDYDYGFVVGNPSQFAYVEVKPSALAEFQQKLAAGKPNAKVRFTVADVKTTKVGDKSINGVRVRVKEADVFVAGQKVIAIPDDDAY